MGMELTDIQKFVEDGYLQEVNRQFFHPLGLALAVGKTEAGEFSLYGILKTDDPEGIILDDLEKEKATKVETVALRRAEIRRKALGFVIQPVAEA